MMNDQNKDSGSAIFQQNLTIKSNLKSNIKQPKQISLNKYNLNPISQYQAHDSHEANVH